MLKKKKYMSVLTLLLVFGLFLTGCQKEEETEKVVAPAEKVVEEENEIELSDWNGTWNNMGAYLNDQELEQAFEEVAVREETSAEQVKQALVDKVEINFDGLIVEGNKVKLLDGFADSGGSIIEELDYTFKDSLTVKHGNFDTEWYAFESDADNEYKYLLMMPVHGEEALTHFHLRYGDDLDKILESEDWYPILIKPESTYEQLKAEVTE